MTLRERFLRWWRPASYYESHPLSEDERRAIAHAAEGVGQAGMRGAGEAPFGRPSIPDDDGPRR